jgi:hypothetical protein
MPVSPDVQAEIDRRGRSVTQIERDIAARTDRLTTNIDELITKLAPSRLVKDGVGKLKSHVTTPDGRPRGEIVGAVAGAVATIGVLLWWARRR